MPRDFYPEEIALLASGSRTADPTINPASFVEAKKVGVEVVIDSTVIGTGSITCFIEGRAAGKLAAPAGWYTILASAAITTNLTTVLTVHPSVTDAANSKAGRSLPRSWRIRIVHNNANAATYSVDVNTLDA